jgi:competence protein ComEA
MKNLLEQLNPIFQKNKIELAIVSIALLITLISIFLYISTKTQPIYAQEETTIPKEKSFDKNQPTQSKIWIEVSGAVNKPDVYEVSPEARLKDILSLSGGLSSNADKNFFARNFNLSRFLTDQEKIHVPSTWEVQSGLFAEQKRLVDSDSSTQSETTVENSSGKISINNASLEELDSLPGVGKTTAEKIIDNRPYTTVEELIDKKAVGESVFEKVQDLIEL